MELEGVGRSREEPPLTDGLKKEQCDIFYLMYEEAM